MHLNLSWNSVVHFLQKKVPVLILIPTFPQAIQIQIQTLIRPHQHQPLLLLDHDDDVHQHPLVHLNDRRLVL